MESKKIVENVKAIKSELQGGNVYGEKVLLVAATKTQTAEAIDAAIEGGVDAIAENRVQEFRDKNEAVSANCSRHFIGHLQTNKVKYLVGKIDLFHSCDRDELAAELSRLSLLRGVVSNVLVQVNIGNEETKGGYPLSEAYEAYLRLKSTPALCVQGFMAMLPVSDDEGLLVGLIEEMRALYERAKKEDDNIRYLSMGMSGDYKLCVAHGSNVVRIGSTIFGARG